MTPLMMALALLQAQAAPSAPAIQTSASQTAQIPWAKQFDMPSAITVRTYRIYVAKPPVGAPKTGWPVVYVLDADITFSSLAAQMVMRSASGGNGAIIVGVGYPNAVATLQLRNRDLTPSAPNAASIATGEFGKVEVEDFGRADDFYRFMTEELQPQIASKNRVDASKQTLMGY